MSKTDEQTPTKLERLTRAIQHKLGDIPIRDAVLAWNDTKHGDGRVIILPHSQEEQRWCGSLCDQLQLTCTFGACNAYWTEGGTKKMCHRLLVEAWRIAIDEGVDIRKLHEVLLVVPELRAIIGKDAPWPYAG